MRINQTASIGPSADWQLPPDYRDSHRSRSCRRSGSFTMVSLPVTLPRLDALRNTTQKPPRVSLDGLCRCVVFAWRCASSSGARTRCLFLFGRTASIRRLVALPVCRANDPRFFSCVIGGDALQASAAVLTTHRASICGRSKYSGGGGNSLVPGPVQASHASRARAGRSRQCQSKWAGPRVSALETALATAPFLFCPAGL
jgi:hypothetical protein